MTDINQSIVDPVANNAQPVNKAEDDDKKVFAGNLAFATTEDQLKNLFSEAGTVTHAQIITRGTRSLGYGFVTFSTNTEAQTAIQLLNKRDVDGREISVESAKPQTASAAVAAADGDKPKARRTRSKKAKESSRAPRRARADEGEEGAAEEDAAKAATNGDGANGADATKPSKSAKRRQKKKAAAAAAAANGETTNANADSSEAQPRAPRAKRQPKGKPQGEPSKTLVFVANLAFATTDDSLKAAFSDYKVKSAHVVKRRNGDRSKGFGFVDFEDASEQQRAIASAQGKQIDGRDVTLQVAVQSDKADEQVQAAEPTSAAV
ncbi:glycine-rich RNA binding protein [Pseudozyma hubeiensis SY62]|uniref:Glycine-rich RNA binding protein n=1 Tax=Pseudozyma hubeiensis (strain SY62) TaxID=1305764 RepID=R9P8Z0_PSEHS|nr:glycine-rich RNA binding protein [Pseudozyma hubeiensis SY62]GAC94570.1 glycine-rich RNA binding protein [Pseudozyma hubeiensis SY62]